MEQTSPLQAIYFRDFNNSYIPNILKEIYLDKLYTRFTTGKRDLIIADWGANIGLTSYYFKDFASKVYAVEPSKRHLESLKTMVEFNKIDNVIVCPYAISNVNGKTKFYHNTNTTMFSLKSEVNDKQDYEEVETFTPDSFMEKEGIDHIDLLKCDLEGYESEVLNSDGFTKVAPKIKSIVLEYHTWGSSSISNLEHRLQDLGYTTERLKTEATVVAATRL